VSILKRNRYAGDAAQHLVVALEGARQDKLKTEPTMLASSGGVPSKSTSQGFEHELGQQGSFARSMKANPNFGAYIADSLNRFDVNAGLAQPANSLA
jgi:hypothetical protein